MSIYRLLLNTRSISGSLWKTEDVVYEGIPRTRHGRWMSEGFEPELVSVIVPTYNRAGLIVDSLDSVFAQTYRPIELLVVDDGSTDNTREVVKEWGRKLAIHDRFLMRYFYQVNAGAPAARNLGLIESRGQYIQFLDSDDLLPPERLTTVIRAMEESGAQYCYTGIELFCPETRKIIETSIPSKTADPLIEVLHDRMWIQTALFTYRRAFCLDLGPWDESLIVYQDYDQGIRAVTSGQRHIAIPKPLISIRYAGKSGVSEHRLSKEGYECRIRCLGRLCRIVKPMDIYEDAKRALVTRLYGLGVILYGKGFDDLGRRAGQLGERMGLEPAGSAGIRMRKIWRMGRLASYLYCLGSSVKFRLSRILRKRTKLFRSDENANAKSGDCTQSNSILR